VVREYLPPPGRKLPADAFDYYVGLGEGRTYRAVAKYYDVGYAAVARTAERDEWEERLQKITLEARARTDEMLVETIEQMSVRHRKMLRAMAARAIKAIQEYPLTSGMEGMRAAETVIKLERLIAGESTGRTEHSIEQVIKNEFNTIMRPVSARVIEREEPEELPAPRRRRSAPAETEDT